MKKSKIFILVVLVILFGIFMLFSCNTPDATDDSTKKNETSKALSETFPIILDGNANYVIVVPNNCEDYITNGANDLRNYIINTGTVKNIRVVNDSGNFADSFDGREILIGLTNRAESANVYEDVMYNDWRVGTGGDKILIAAHNESKMTEAIEYVIEGMNKSDEKNLKCKIEHKEVFESYKLSGFKLLNKDISLYQIVYSEDIDISGSKDIALTIKNLIGENSGYALNVSNKASGTDPIIYVGTAVKTNGLRADFLGYSIGALEENFSVYYSNRYFGKFALEYIEQAITSAAENSSVNLDTLAHTKAGVGVDLKIISYNVLVSTTTGGTYNRDDIAADMILGEMPDVFGLQEFEPLYRTATGGFVSQIAAFYSEASVAGLDPNLNWNPIYYRYDMYNLLDCGNVSFSIGTEYNNAVTSDKRSHFRSFTWAVFEDKATKIKFIVINTHYDTNVEAQPSQAGEISEAAKNLYEQYNCAIFVTGDYNSNVTSGVAVSTMKNNGFLDMHDLTPAANRDDLRSYGGVPEIINGVSCPGADVTPYYATAIDHIFFYGNGDAVFAKEYKTIISDYNIRASSDHVPVCIKVSIY